MKNLVILILVILILVILVILVIVGTKLKSKFTKVIETDGNIGKHTVLLKNNLGKLYCPFSPDFVCDEIKKNKIWEEHIQQEFEKYVKQGDTVIDAGAYVGIHTLKLSKLVSPSGLVYAFEPDPETFKILQHNIKLNNINNVKLFNVALGDKESNLEIKKTFDANKGATQWKYKDDFSNVVSKTITIDSLDLKKLNFIKIDVEEMESSVFRGMENTIKKFKPIILFESFKENNDKNFKILSNYGYTIENIKDHDYIAKFNNQI